jgi:methoxymalonate biosynthesis acyl carrier protein
MDKQAISNMKKDITDYVLLNANDKNIDEHVPIFELGYVNSLFAIELMCFLEQNFAIKITTDDLEMNNFRTINTICDFVRSKKEQNDVGEDG